MSLCQTWIVGFIFIGFINGEIKFKSFNFGFWIALSLVMHQKTCTLRNEFITKL